MLRTRQEAAKNAEEQDVNVPGTCQLWTRNRYGAPSAGDRDGDGDADAVDGWLSEPASARHVGDRNPPRGTPVAFSGGSKGYGHRAISLGNGLVRSTDMRGSSYVKGSVGTCAIRDIERAMGVTYLGWSVTITGIKIPSDTPPKPVKKTRGARVDKALTQLLQAQRIAIRKNEAKNTPATRARVKALNSAIKTLVSIPQRKA